MTQTVMMTMLSKNQSLEEKAGQFHQENSTLMEVMDNTGRDRMRLTKINDLERMRSKKTRGKGLILRLQMQQQGGDEDNENHKNQDHPQHVETLQRKRFIHRRPKSMKMKIKETNGKGLIRLHRK